MINESQTLVELKLTRCSSCSRYMVVYNTLFWVNYQSVLTGDLTLKLSRSSSKKLRDFWNLIADVQKKFIPAGFPSSQIIIMIITG